MQLKQLDADSETEGKNDEGSDLANGEFSGMLIFTSLLG